MEDFNSCTFTGRLVADPEMRFTSNGGAVTTFKFACNRSHKNASGERVSEVEWVSCVAWSKLAEICNQYLTKGMRVLVEGRMQTRSWDDKQTGEKRYRTEIILNKMQMLDRSEKQASTPAEMDDEDIPF